LSELHKFIFEGLPVRGIIVRLTDSWTEILRRRASNNEHGGYAAPVRETLGQMAAAGVLMQSSIKFDGALVLQIMGDGPIKLAVVEVQSNLELRATASVRHPVPDGATLSQMVNVNNQGKCAITLDPQTKFPGQQPYQGVVPLFDDEGRPIENLNEVLEHYMLQSEQLDTTLVLAADDQVAAGLLIQRLPVQGEGNLSGSLVSKDNEDQIGLNEHYNRISILAHSLKREELLSLDVDTVLRRLFWEERLTRFAPAVGELAPRFCCSCSRERVARMIVGLGADEAYSILQERPDIEVACEFCGLQYHFDPVDTARLFVPATQQIEGGDTPH
jgi:molecular chaperone Hsp33